MRRLLPALVIVVAGSAYAKRQPLEWYDGLINRQMFGPVGADFDPTKMPNEVAKSSKDGAALTEEQEKVKKAIHFSVINVTPEGETVVGFSDNGNPKGAVHYYLKVGESRNGWTVKSADPEEATMTIEKDGIEVALKLGGDSSTDANAVSRVGGANASAGGRSKIGGRQNFMGIRESRQLREQQREAEAAQRMEEQQKQHEAIMGELQATREELRREREELSARETEKSMKEASSETPSQPPPEGESPVE